MRIAFFSDLHVEHWGRLFGEDFVQTNLLERLADECKAMNPDIVINLGDTANAPYLAHNPNVLKDMFKDLSYIEIMGNHDYYLGTFGSTCEMYTFGEEKIFAGTLWTNFRRNPLAAMVAQRSINDFRLIKECTSDVMINAHTDAISMIKREQPTIVATHFPPAIQCTSERHSINMLSNYFINDDEDVIAHLPSVKIWLAGHTHADFDVKVHDIRVVSNQLGYPSENFNDMEDYHPKLVYV